MEATYQVQDRAKALATIALPLYDKKRIFQNVKELVTASIRGSQLAASMSLKPIKIPRTFIVSHDQSMATGRSGRPLQEPNQRPKPP